MQTEFKVLGPIFLDLSLQGSMTWKRGEQHNADPMPVINQLSLVRRWHFSVVADLSDVQNFANEV